MCFITEQVSASPSLSPGLIKRSSYCESNVASQHNLQARHQPTIHGIDYGVDVI